MENSDLLTPFQLVPSTFAEVEPIWKNFLWPGRISKIDPSSAICFKGGYNTDYMSREVHFWTAQVERAKSWPKIVGVISGFATEQGQYRSRGIWVDPDYRRQGLGQALFKKVEAQARSLDCHMVWTMPRLSAQSFYQSLGLERVGETSEFEFGPHLWMMKNV